MELYQADIRARFLDICSHSGALEYEYIYMIQPCKPPLPPCHGRFASIWARVVELLLRVIARVVRIV